MHSLLPANFAFSGAPFRLLTQIMGLLSDSLLLLSLCTLWRSVLTDRFNPNADERRLLRRLLSESYHDKRVRPVEYFNDSVQLKINMALRQIIDIDERNQVLHSNVWVRQYWKNPFFVWNESEYGGIKKVNIDPSLMWLPDTVLYNNVEVSKGANLDKILETRVSVNSNGEILWLAPAILASTCDIDVRYFPFDAQHCDLVIASWTYNGWELNVTNYASRGDTSNYVKSSEWHLVGMTAHRTEIKYPCCVEPYPTVTFTIHVRRRPLYYLTNLIIPCGIITVLALFSFYAPPESGERIGLVITTLLAMTVFMLLVAEAMPATSDVIPLVAKFYIVAMVVIAFNLAATCLCVKYFYMDPTHRKMPMVIKIVLVDWLAPVFGVQSQKSAYSNANFTENDFDVDDYHNSYDSVITKNGHCITTTVSPKTRPMKETCKYWDRHNTILRRLVNEVKIISNKVRDEEKREVALREWKVAARVLDVIFFTMFLIIIIAASIAIFSEAPSYQD